jgi:TrmH family RNA methyltransferase
VQPITSYRNTRVKYLRSLRLRKYRQKEGLFLAEGIRVVGEALASRALVETLVYAPDLLVSERARALVNQVDPQRHLVLSGDVFRSLSDRDQPQGIAVVVRIGDRPLADVYSSSRPGGESLLVVVAYQLQDPGNLGSIIRTADAAGATGLIVVEPSVDLYAPQTVRATMGSIFSLPIVRMSDVAALSSWYSEMRAAGLPLLVAATSAHAQQVYFEVDFCRPLVLLIGSERQGLPLAIRNESDVAIKLPMAGQATSLNASAATAALLYEAVRQRRTRGESTSRAT